MLVILVAPFRNTFLLSALNETAYKESKAYVDVVHVLKRHAGDAAVQSAGLLALTTLLEMDSFAASSMALAGDFDFLFASIKRHSWNVGVVTHGFQSLRCIVKYVVTDTADHDYVCLRKL